MTIFWIIEKIKIFKNKTQLSIILIVILTTIFGFENNVKVEGEKIKSFNNINEYDVSTIYKLARNMAWTGRQKS